MRLTFPWTGVETILEELRTARTAKTLYAQETGKGFWLVGDEGVYLMPNTTDGCHHKHLRKDEKRLVVYAEQCDPTTLDFDEWWDNKRASFGGDDGIEFIALALMERLRKSRPQQTAKPSALLIDFMPEQFGFGIIWHPVEDNGAS